MLGVAENPYFSPSDQAMKDVATEMGVGHTFQMAPLGIYFGEGKGIAAKDPYFGGVGPDRNGCQQCGACMTGCKFNAKNTLPKNYLGLAESAGAQVFPMTTVKSFSQNVDGTWEIRAVRSNDPFATVIKFKANQVIVAAGTYNTQKLLHAMKRKTLPQLSNHLGQLSRTNSEALTGAMMPNTDIDFSAGSAITSSFFPDEHTHIEPVRYGKGSNFMGLMQTIMTDGYNSTGRRRHWLKQFIANPSLLTKILNVRRWSQRTVIALTMQNVDSSVTVSGKRGLFGWHLTSTNDPLKPNATYIPAANEVVRRIADKHGGIAGGHVGDLIDAPFTAHFVGGCVIAEDAEHGVIDPYHRVYNYPTLHIVDGSTITANLGVNPSLTITAQAERALSMWPNKGDADLRPVQGGKYLRIFPIAPNQPFVPAGAVGALKIS
jgi:cholesterol oxidase